MNIRSYYFNLKRIKSTFSNIVGVYLLLSFAGFLCQSSYAQEIKASSLKNLGLNINSLYEEMNPVLSPDGSILYFCRGRHPENTGGRKDKGDIWYSLKDENGNWQKAQNIGSPINNGFKNDLAGISADGNTLFLNYNYSGDGKTSEPGISYSKRTTEGWSQPSKINIPYFYNASEHQSVFISKDENIIIFSIDSYGTHGAEDLYVSFRQPSGTYSEPMNLGPELNSVNQEITPYLAKDNKTLFFVSNGRKGVGSKDIYKSQRLDKSWKKWSEPVNLGPQVNTEGMEMYYFQDALNSIAYLVSTQNSDGYGDIHQINIRKEDIPDLVTDENVFPEIFLTYDEPDEAMFQVPDTVIVFSLEPEVVLENIPEEIPSYSISGNVYNAVTKKGIAATVTLLFENEELVKIIADGEKGSFNLNISEAGKFTVKTSAKGYLAKEEIIEVANSDTTKELSFNLTPLEVGTTIQLHDVLFERGTSKILENSYFELDKVANMMLDNPTLYIELAGHTDNQGVAKLNIKLSQERVENVKKYLIQKSVEPFRISGKGYGGIKPIASNKNEETRKLNRRVEFTIVKN